MSSESHGKGRNAIWLLPVLGVLFILAFGLLARLMIGPTSEEKTDLWTTPFVPAESPYATGPDAR